MSTHDYVIANQNGANTRSDLNSAFSAIVSNNSSASEPSTTYAYMWWADTTNDLLKQRNAADSAWVDILTLSTGAPSVGGATEGSAVLSTGETGGVKFLREDGDGTSSWQSIVSDPTMGGDLSGTASNAQIVANAVGNTEMANDAIGVAELSATGTASSSTYLRGDNAWASVPAAGADTSLSNLSATGENKVCQAWVNFNGTGTVAIIDSHNVSSITDNATGEQTVNFSSAMANTNYSVMTGLMKNNDSGADLWTMAFRSTNTKSTTQLRIATLRGSSLYDCSSVCLSVFGD
jgi:hypothetical protein